jgi:lipopolysaccharide transport protein LptA
MFVPIVFGVLCLNAVIPATTARAEGQNLIAGKNNRDHQTYIWADRLLIDNDTHSAEYAGNVRATRGDRITTAERLKIFYSVDKKKNQGVTGEEAVQKIIATGAVTIRFGDVVAKTQRAVYTRANQTIVLSGANSWIGDGKNSVAGTTITLYMEDNRIRVSRGDNQRVKAVFQTGTQQ